MFYNKTTITLALLATVGASIKTDGIWTGNDVDETIETKIGVTNGVPYSNDAATSARIDAAKPLDGMMSDYATKTNVVRVKAAMDKNAFENTLFPVRKSVYTYEGFLEAVSKFPKFCGENSLSNYDEDEACKKELATLFAHFAQESGHHSDSDKDALGQTIDKWRQGLYHIHEDGCPDDDGNYDAKCDDYRTVAAHWATKAYPMSLTEDYYGRGPFQLSWNYNYGEFSEMLGVSKYDSKLTLLNNPGQVETDSVTIMESALWFYMTPQSPKPSMHQVATGSFVPNASDTAAGISNGFGATINIINGLKECNSGAVETPHAASRIDFYKSLVEYFDIEKDTETNSSMSCKAMKAYPTDSAGKVYAYFAKDSANSNKCKVVSYMTEYSVYTENDYKRCVCDSWGSGASDCGQ